MPKQDRPASRPTRNGLDEAEIFTRGFNNQTRLFSVGHAHRLPATVSYDLNTVIADYKRTSGLACDLLMVRQRILVVRRGHKTGVMRDRQFVVHLDSRL